MASAKNAGADLGAMLAETRQIRQELSEYGGSVLDIAVAGDDE